MSLITGHLLTTNSDTSNVSTYNTASVAPTGGRLVLISIVTAGSVQPTVTGGGMTTWELVASRGNVLGNNILWVFRAQQASPTSGAITIDFGGAGQTGCLWSVEEFANVAIGGNGAYAIRQSATVNPAVAVTTLAVTLASFGRNQNATFGSFHVGSATLGAITEGSGFTELSDISMATPVKALFTEFRNDNDTTVDITWSSASTSNASGIALELVGVGYPKVMMV